jgi:oligosaccharide repeat unit polymerase
MEIALFLVLASMLVLYAYITNYDLLNPGVIFLATWVISSFVTVIYAPRWHLDVSWRAFLVVVIGAFAFCIGILISMSRLKKWSLKRHSLGEQRTEKKLSDRKLIMVLLYLFLAILYLGVKIYEVSVLSGNEWGILHMFEYARYGLTHLDLNLGRWSAYFLRINYGLGIVLFYFFCDGLFREKFNAYRLKLLGLVALTIATTIFSTGRTQMLGLMAAYMMLFLLEYARDHAWQDPKHMRRVFLWMVASGVSFVILFVLFGIVALNRLGGLSILDNIAVYVGSPIPALSHFLEYRYYYPYPTYFGENTFISIYGTLKSFLIITETAESYLKPIASAYVRTNVYTLYYQYIADWDSWVVPIFMSINGAFYGSLYAEMKYSRRGGVFMKLMYATMMYSLVAMFFQEAFFSLFNTHVMRYGFALIAYFLLITEPGRIRRVFTQLETWIKSRRGSSRADR